MSDRSKDDKAPAFQFYPRDWDTDENVIPMTYEEEGVYWALCRRYWLSGRGLPNDLDELRALLKGNISRVKMEQLWRRIGRCFQVVNDQLAHKRLDKERAKQAENKARRRDAADERWRKEAERKKAAEPTARNSNADAHAPPLHMQCIESDDAMQCLASASASASATAVVAEPRQQLGPRPFDKQHAKHVFGFCDWVCLPAFLLAEFVNRGGQDEGAVTAWALEVRHEWQGRTIGDSLEFWRARWKERALRLSGSSATSSTAHDSAETARRYLRD